MAHEQSSKSPFPGMNPYLQAHWSGVHTRLMTYAADALQPQLPGDLVARVEENVRLDVDDELRALRTPDVDVAESRIPWETRSADPAVALNEPIILLADPDPFIERHIEITDGHSGRVITAIEFISPWNKTAGVGLRDYMAKREQYLDARASLVEVDLIRGGKWHAMVPPYFVPAEHRTTYRVTVKRAGGGARLELYPIALGQRLPAVRVPLRPADPDVSLDLQSLIDQVYRNGAFDRTDYSKPCDPPFDEREQAWVTEVLARR